LFVIGRQMFHHTRTIRIFHYSKYYNRMVIWIWSPLFLMLSFLTVYSFLISLVFLFVMGFYYTTLCFFLVTILLGYLSYITYGKTKVVTCGNLCGPVVSCQYNNEASIGNEINQAPEQPCAQIMSTLKTKHSSMKTTLNNSNLMLNRKREIDCHIAEYAPVFVGSFSTEKINISNNHLSKASYKLISRNYCVSIA